MATGGKCVPFLIRLKGYGLCPALLKIFYMGRKIIYVRCANLLFRSASTSSVSCPVPARPSRLSPSSKRLDEEGCVVARTNLGQRRDWI